MGYIALSLTVATSILAIRFWLRFLTPRIKRMNELSEYGNRDLLYGGAVIGYDRPDPFRTGCNLLAAGIGMLIPGGFHVFAITGFWRFQQITPTHFILYGSTLTVWLGFLGIAAAGFLGNREARARRLAKSQ